MKNVCLFETGSVSVGIKGSSYHAQQGTDLKRNILTNFIDVGSTNFSFLQLLTRLVSIHLPILELSFTGFPKHAY